MILVSKKEALSLIAVCLFLKKDAIPHFPEGEEKEFMEKVVIDLKAIYDRVSADNRANPSNPISLPNDAAKIN